MARQVQSVAHAWPADQVERRRVVDLVPNARNARIHSEQQISQIAGLITEFGWTVPILLDEDGTIIAGHGRVLAAQQLGIDSVPCMIARGWDDAQKRAYAIADNQIALLSTWDLGVLKSEIGELRGIGFDSDMMGFSDAELQNLFLDRSQGSNSGEWESMPEYENEDQEGFRIIKVHFDDQAAVDEFCKRLKITLSEQVQYMWFPPKEKEDLLKRSYQAKKPTGAKNAPVKAPGKKAKPKRVAKR